MSRSIRWSFLVALAVCTLPGIDATLLHAQQPKPGVPVHADPVAHGRYIVEDVAMCWMCHTPVDEHGVRDRSHWLRGGQVAVTSTLPGADAWAIIAPRLAGGPAGTDAQFVALMTTGISRTGRALRVPMPQFRMSQADAEAVLAYLRSLGVPTTEHAGPAQELTRK